MSAVVTKNGLSGYKREARGKKERYSRWRARSGPLAPIDFSAPVLFKYSFTKLEMVLPKKPLDAESGDRCMMSAQDAWLNQ